MLRDNDANADAGGGGGGEAPRFVIKPRSVTVQEGDSLSVECQVIGQPKPDVVWLRDWLNVSTVIQSFLFFLFFKPISHFVPYPFSSQRFQRFV